jgi:hypothetical protein
VSEPLVRVADPGCSCMEPGSDGTMSHSGEVVGRARADLIVLEVIAEFCENHRANYSHWEQLEDSAKRSES